MILFWLMWSWFTFCQDKFPHVHLTFLTHCGIVWVLGERWCVLITMTVMIIEVMTNTMVNNIYLPIKGTALEVEGMSSTMTKRNTVKDRRTEMLRVIFSPGVGKIKQKWISWGMEQRGMFWHQCQGSFHKKAHIASYGRGTRRQMGGK